MSRFKILSAKTAAAALSAAMIFQGTAMAAPIDELNEIFEKQEELQADSLMEETLGLSELGESIGDNGLQFQIKAALDPQTFELMREESGLSEEEAEILKGGYALLGLQTDPELKKWLLGASLGSEEGSLLDISLYGDEEQLALSLPQFYAGALALKAGNFKEQLLNSDLATIIGITEENASEIPEIDMSFYPEEDDLNDTAGIFDGIQERLEEKAEEVEENIQVEKTESGDVTTYAVTVDTADIMDVYEIIFDEYMSLIMEPALISASGADAADVDTQIDQLLSEIESILGDTVTMNFDVRDGLVEKISYALYMDTAALEQAAENIEDAVVEEAAAAAGNAENAVPAEESATEVQSETVETVETPEQIIEIEDGFRGYVSYEFSYTDPAQPAKGIECRIEMTDEEDAESAVILVGYATETEGTAETATLSLDVQENGESVYSGTPFTASFDAATGDLDAVFSVTDEDTSMEMKLDSTFTEIEKGKSFVLTIDELSMTVDGEKVGMTSEIKVSADPGEITVPAESRVVLELTQGGLLDLVNEISANAQAWSAQFAPEQETELGGLEASESEPVQTEAVTE